MSGITRVLRMAAAVPFIAGAISCSERQATSPLVRGPASGPGASLSNFLMTCDANVPSRTVTCESSSPPAAGARGVNGDVIIGGGDPGLSVRLTSSGTSYDPASQIFSTFVNVQNLTAHPMGTTDDLTTLGFKVFFHSGPTVTSGTGIVTVSNADGVGTFTGPNQPFFQYPSLLDPQDSSNVVPGGPAAKRWEWTVPTTVQSFTFQVFVQAPFEAEGQLASSDSLIDVSVGALAACARSAAGAAYCWGLLGTRHVQSQGLETLLEAELGVPNLVPGTPSFRVLRAGNGVSCGLTNGGDLYCWGIGFVAALSSSLIGNFSPAIHIGASTKFTDVALSQSSACALSQSGTAYCFGGNSPGSEDPLGTGDSVDFIASPTPVLNSPAFVSITGGIDHFCGLTAEGKAYCWGDNTAGALGSGAVVPTDPSQFNPHACYIDHVCSQPQLVANGQQFATIAASFLSTCALDLGGQAWCWGANDQGQLGNGQIDALLPNGQRPDHVTPAAIASSVTFSSLASDGGAGEGSFCGVAKDATGYCWGNNGDAFTLGSAGGVACGQFLCVATPTPISGGLKFKQVSIAQDLGCGVSVAGPVFCWGFNGDGELGINSPNNPNRTPTPQRVYGSR